MGLDKFSNLGSFEEMVEAQDTAPETVKTVKAETADATEVVTEKAEAEIVGGTPIFPADNLETPKNN
jgi:hypothetical protein